MSRWRSLFVVVGGAVVLASAGSALAAEVWMTNPSGELVPVAAVEPTPAGAPDDGDGEAFGVAVGEYHWLSCSSFAARNSDQTRFSDAAHDYCYRSGGSEKFFLADLDVPTGAYLNALRLFYLDSSASNDLSFHLCRKWMDTPGGTNLDADCPWEVTPTGSPGYTSVVMAPDTVVQRRFDVDSDSTVETVRWLVFVGLPVDSQVRLGAVRTHWLRVVSPAPASATFGDVPTNHPFFQHVEALAASGITAGCGSSNYCPDQPVTRGQMAVFLAKALGLHWSDF